SLSIFAGRRLVLLDRAGCFEGELCEKAAQRRRSFCSGIEGSSRMDPRSRVSGFDSGIHIWLRARELALGRPLFIVVAGGAGAAELLAGALQRGPGVDRHETISRGAGGAGTS